MDRDAKWETTFEVVEEFTILFDNKLSFFCLCKSFSAFVNHRYARFFYHCKQ